MHILITGATGYLGNKLVKELLLSGHQISCIVRNSSKLEEKAWLKDVKIFDVKNLKIINIFEGNNIECIIHCATSYGRDFEDLPKIIDANITFPLKILHASKKYGVKYFVNTDTALQAEVSEYSFTKKQFLNWLNFFSNDIKIINILLEHFYGPNDKDSKFINNMINRLKDNKNIKIPLTKGDQKRDFIYIDDVVSAYICIINNLPKFNKNFNNVPLGTNELISIKDLVLLIKDRCGNKRTVLDFGKIPSRVNEINSNADLALIKQLGWNQQYSLKDGISRTIKLTKS